MIRYTPADAAAWVVLAAPRRVLAVDSSLTGRATDLAARLVADDGFAGALEEIVRHGILTAPDFALLDWSTGSLRAVLRGATRMTVVAPGGEVTSSRSGVATWVEQVVESPRSVRLEFPGGVVDDQLFGATIIRTVAGAAVRLPSDEAGRLPLNDAERLPRGGDERLSNAIAAPRRSMSAGAPRRRNAPRSR